MQCEERFNEVNENRSRTIRSMREVAWEAVYIMFDVGTRWEDLFGTSGRRYWRAFSGHLAKFMQEHLNMMQSFLRTARTGDLAYFDFHYATLADAQQCRYLFVPNDGRVKQTVRRRRQPIFDSKYRHRKWSRT